MITIRIVRISCVFVILSFNYLFIGCDAKPQSQAFTAACNTTLAIGGVWNVAFKCENGDCIPGRDSYEVTQDLSDPTQVTAEIIDSTLSGDIGVIFEGDLCGMIFTFSAIDPSNDESGSWTFSDAQNFTKLTTFGGGQHTCIGTGTKPPFPLPADVICPVP